MLERMADVVFVPIILLRHIENYSHKRVHWLAKKIQSEKLWTKPLCVDKKHHLVMDGQHRLEVARMLDLIHLPCLLFDYEEVEIWSLRHNYIVDYHTVISRALSDHIYPYKTVKHRFPIAIPQISIPLQDLALTNAYEEGSICV